MVRYCQMYIRKNIYHIMPMSKFLSQAFQLSKAGGGGRGFENGCLISTVCGVAALLMSWGDWDESSACDCVGCVDCRAGG